MDKLIVYVDADGQERVVAPSVGKRSVRGFDVVFDPPMTRSQVDAFTKSIVTSAQGVTIGYDYAETEDEFLQRLAEKVVPSDAGDMRFVEREDYDAERQAKEEASGQQEQPGS